MRVRVSSTLSVSRISPVPRISFLSAIRLIWSITLFGGGLPQRRRPLADGAADRLGCEGVSCVQGEGDQYRP